MLAYYVEWHMREAWRALMFADTDQAAKATRDLVAPTQRPAAALNKAACHTLGDGTPAHSFSTLVAELGCLVRNTYPRRAGGPNPRPRHDAQCDATPRARSDPAEPTVDRIRNINLTPSACRARTHLSDGWRNFGLIRYPVDRMPSFFNHADALLVSLKDTPIFAMTIPGKLQSYLASGTPVLTMLNGEGVEIARDSSAGLSCPADDGRALAAAVLELAGMSANARTEVEARGLALSRAEFDLETLISTLLSWFSSLVEGNQQRLRKSK